MKIISIAAAMIVTTSALAQDIWVGNVTVIPASASPTDNIQIALETGTPYLGQSIGHTFSISEDTVHIVGCFLEGVAAQPEAYYDTVTIGTLPTGLYHVKYEARISGDGLCNTQYSNDWGETDFQVGTLSVTEQENDFGMYLFPNPATDYQNITVTGIENQKLHIDLFDMQGRCIRNVFTGVTESGGVTVKINIANLTPALYLYRIRCGDHTKTIRFIKS